MPIYSNQFTVGTATAIEIVAPDVEAQEAWIHDNANSQNLKENNASQDLCLHA